MLVQAVIDAAVEEAEERQIELNAPEVTFRLLCALDRGIRDEDELRDAIVFNAGKVYLQ